MYIVVSKSDQFSLRFVSEVLEAQRRAEDERSVGFWLSGGGTIQVNVRTVAKGEIIKGSYSCRLVTNRIGPWGDARDVEVVLNPGNDGVVRRVRELLGQMQRESKDWIAPKHLRGRSGAILFDELAYTRRVVWHRDVVPADFPPNRFIGAASGLDRAAVTYGTTDAANAFELLQAVKAGWYMKMPVVFDQYESAHTVGDYWLRVAGPSFQMLGVNLTPEDLGLDPAGKFTQTVDFSVVERAFSQAGLTTKWSRRVTGTFADWYRQAMVWMSAEVERLLGLYVSLRIVPMERLLEQTSFWEQPVRRYAQQLHELAGHEVGVINTSDTARLRTRDLLPIDTLAEIHQKGWWLAGYPVYQLGYLLGTGGGLVTVVKDGSKGEVHRLARPYLDDPQSGLYLLPVNLFRLHAVGQDENASIDPWVFLELLRRWGEYKASDLVQQIWDLMEVPLRFSHVGQETRVAVSLDGLDVQVKQT